MSEPTVEIRQVRLLQLPVRLAAEAKQHTDELLREFRLIVTADNSSAAGARVPQRLIAVITALRQQYGNGSSERDAQVFAALEAGVEYLDMNVELPAAAAPVLRALAELLDEADDFCRSGQHLLTLAAPPRPLEYRRWYLAELVAQLEGATPTPWTASPRQR